MTCDGRKAIIWTNAGNLSEMLIEIHAFSFKQVYVQMSAKRRHFCVGISVLESQLMAHPAQLWSYV